MRVRSCLQDEERAMGIKSATKATNTVGGGDTASRQDEPPTSKSGVAAGAGASDAVAGTVDGRRRRHKKAKAKGRVQGGGW
jgi:hypothetical protein